MTRPSGLFARHHSGSHITGQAWSDYDGDGWADLYVTTQHGTNTLYDNNGDGTFSVSPFSPAVAMRAGLSGGAVFADYDNDGWPDLYVTTEGRDRLFHNEAGRGFTDVTEHAGLPEEDAFGMTASWGDYDGDGYLDLYVANYGCEPCDGSRIARGEQDRLYHNERDGTFSAATDALRISEGTAGFAFVAGWLDYDLDADLDVYVVNDVRGTPYLRPNVLLRNDGPGCRGWCFTDVSESSGAGVRVDGMGLAVDDYDADRDLDLYMTNTGWSHLALTGPSVLLRNNGDGTFSDVSNASGAAVDAVGWGTAFLDYDADGWQDLYVALGFDMQFEGPQATRNRLLRNRGDGTFADATGRSGAGDERDSLGVAAGDLNNDGRTDLVVGDFDDRYRLFANAGTAGNTNKLLTVWLHGAGPVNRDAVGARVYVTTLDGHTQLQQVMAGASLGAGNDLALQFGLGQSAVQELRVVWPDGREQSFSDVPANVRWDLTYGGQRAVSPLAETNVPRSPVRSLPVQGTRLGGLLIPALGALSLLGLGVYLIARRRARAVAPQLLVVLAGATVVFQIGHMLEHSLQLGQWWGHRAEPPWISPWGLVATDGFTALAGHHGGRATGTELLHLAGNVIFLSGLVALYAATRRSATVPRAGRRALAIAFWFELVHVAEHILLTTTWFVWFRPVGLSTLFGYSLYLPGVWGTSIRLWWHFVMNLVPTAALLIGLASWWRRSSWNLSSRRIRLSAEPSPATVN